tara:strand:+ start:205 stop:603 length:399 start_codon:yes stop_codon:yes gene_type:complete
MPDLKNAKIYKIVCNQTKLVYYGSTTQALNLRLNQHRCKTPTNGLLLSSRIIMDNADYNIHLVEEYPCDNKKDLLIRERFYIDNNPCVNIRKAHRTIEDIRSSSRERYHKNRDKISLKSKERYRLKKLNQSV